MKMFRAFTCGLALALTVALTGCGGGSKLDTVKVTGTVTLDGKPLSNVNVLFTPSGDGNPAMGTVDSTGKFSLTTIKADDGARPGDYKVSVTSAAPAVDSEDPAGGEDPETKAGGGSTSFPAKYNNPNESGLTAKVVAGKANTFEFDLKSS